MIGLSDLLVHFWLIYVFLCNGFVLTLVVCHRSRNFLELLANVECWFLSSFFISILLNGAVLLFCSWAGRSFSHTIYILPLVSVFILTILVLDWSSRNASSRLRFPDFGWGRLLVYVSIFIVLVYNGGLIEQPADSWWHMSLSNKIDIFNSFDVELIGNHLNGVTSRYYPPLWHGNLALLHRMSDISLPVIWNVFTAWGGVLKVMAFYLLALGISNNRNIALLSIVLFVLLPGLGDSYMRVSAWPSHVAYTAWFCMFYITFVVFDKCEMPEIALSEGKFSAPVRGCFVLLKQNKAGILSFLVLALVVFFVHRAELLWFGLGMLFYAVMLLVCSLFFDVDKEECEPANWLLSIYLACGLTAVVYLMCVRYPALQWSVQSLTDTHLLLVLWFSLTSLFVYLLLEHSPLSIFYNKRLARLLFIVVSLVLLLSVDMRQLLSLFYGNVNYSRPSLAGWPVYCTGWLDGNLMLPDWNMQLRQGFLYSGVLGIGASVLLLIFNPKRCTIFLAANSVIPFFFLVSPYLYQGLMDGVAYLSCWRVALLIFHPIILACCLVFFWDKMKGGMYRQ